VSETTPPAGDRWQQALEKELEALKRCQEEHRLASCLACEKILGCEVRSRYVNAVYESMNKGTGGGFEF
jgi:hypothetical protein